MSISRLLYVSAEEDTETDDAEADTDVAVELAELGESKKLKKFGEDDWKELADAGSDDSGEDAGDEDDCEKSTKPSASVLKSGSLLDSSCGTCRMPLFCKSRRSIISFFLKSMI